MSRFFVGQRVRVIGAPADPSLVGSETVITGQRVHTASGNDCWQLGIPSKTGGFWLCAKERAPDLLSPILPEGHQPATQSHEQLMADLRKGVIHA